MRSAVNLDWKDVPLRDILVEDLSLPVAIGHDVATAAWAEYAANPRDGLLFVALGTGIVINYFDRVNLSVATTPLIKEFHFSNTEIGLLLSSYLWSYTLLQIPVGTLLDRIGIKWIMRVGTILWSIASFMTAIVSE